LPLEHNSQVLEGIAEYLPTEQSEQADALERLYVPVEQSVQTVEAANEENFPGTHSSQILDAFREEEKPGKHSRHGDAPERLKYPLGHTRQKEARNLSAYSPDEHSKQ
jgi:hypothetical protein